MFSIIQLAKCLLLTVTEEGVFILYDLYNEVYDYNKKWLKY